MPNYHHRHGRRPHDRTLARHLPATRTCTCSMEVHPAWAHVYGHCLTDDGPRFLDLAADARARSPAQEFSTDRFAALADVAVAIADPSRAQLLDCRALTNNHGILPEDYRTVEIPCTCIVRSPEVVEETPHGQRFRQPAQLAALLAERRVSSHANKSVGAAVVATALEIAGCGPTRVYAGSLIEYAQARRSG
jgi:3-mercaptopyruvate sulfurtransferase SseA